MTLYSGSNYSDVVLSAKFIINCFQILQGNLGALLTEMNQPRNQFYSSAIKNITPETFSSYNVPKN